MSLALISNLQRFFPSLFCKLGWLAKIGILNEAQADLNEYSPFVFKLQNTWSCCNFWVRWMFRILFIVVVHYDYEIWQIDVKTAFLNGNLEEEIYMLQLEGFIAKNQ